MNKSPEKISNTMTTNITSSITNEKVPKKTWREMFKERTGDRYEMKKPVNFVTDERITATKQPIFFGSTKTKTFIEQKLLLSPHSTKSAGVAQSDTTKLNSTSLQSTKIHQSLSKIPQKTFSLQDSTIIETDLKENKTSIPISIDDQDSIKLFIEKTDDPETIDPCCIAINHNNSNLSDYCNVNNNDSKKSAEQEIDLSGKQHCASAPHVPSNVFYIYVMERRESYDAMA